MTHDNKPRRGEDLGNQHRDEADKINGSPLIDEPADTDSSATGNAEATEATTFSQEQVDLAKAKAERVYRWIRDDQPAFVAFADSMKRDARAGRRASPYRALENVRAKEYTNSRGRTTRTPNAAIPFLSRIVCIDHPDVAEHVTMAHSIADAADLHGAASLLEEGYRGTYLS